MGRSRLESRGQSIMAAKRTKVLIVGESAYKIHIHFKGFASYETGYLSAGLDSFTDRFADTPVSFEFMHNHDISLRFPVHPGGDAGLRRDRDFRCAGRQLPPPSPDAWLEK